MINQTQDGLSVVLDVADGLDGLAAGGIGPTGRPMPKFPEPPPLIGHGPARIIAMCNQKGGVGKTTSTINLGAALAEYGRRRCCWSTSTRRVRCRSGSGINPHELDKTVYNLLMDRRTERARGDPPTSNVPDIDLLPANIDLSAAEVQLVNEVAREQMLARVLRPVIDDYDVILIDCQPSLGLLTVNALTAAHGVVIPLECEFFALRGVALLIETIDKVQRPAQPGPRDRRHPRHHVRPAHPALAARWWPAWSRRSATRSSTP